MFTWGLSGSLSVTWTSRCGSAKGSGLIRAASTKAKIATLAPIPSASTRIAVAENPGFFTSTRRAKRRSCQKRSNCAHPQTSCVCCRISVVLPNARRAAYRASSSDRPFSRCSSSSSSRSECSSRSRSASRLLICHHRISALLSHWPHHPRYCLGHLSPPRFFDTQLFSAFLGQTVILVLPISVRAHFPLGSNPAPSLQAMQCGIERTMLHLQEIVSRPLNVLANLVPVRRTVEKCPQYEHV